MHGHTNIKHCKICSPLDLVEQISLAGPIRTKEHNDFNYKEFESLGQQYMKTKTLCSSETTSRDTAEHKYK